MLNLVSRRASVGDQELSLRPKEFSLLAELIRHRSAVLTRDLLLTRAWGYDYVGDSRTVDVHVRWLREKIEADPANPRRIAPCVESAIASKAEATFRPALRIGFEQGGNPT